jgi:multiple sugar transport system substrate-binding protein
MTIVRLNKIAATAAITLALVPVTACSSKASSSSTGAASGSGSTGASANAGVTLTYWASNQGTSLDNDKQVLQPELDKFKAKTGITVNVEVVPWSDLLNRVTAAATSGSTSSP